MIVYISMFVYIYFMGYIGRTNTNRKGICDEYNSRTTLTFAIVILAMPIFFIGMRTNFADTKAYIEGFEAFPKDWQVVRGRVADSRGPGWVIYQWIIKRFISENGNVFIFITAIIQGIAILKFFYKYSRDYAYSILLFFLSCSFTNMMNGTRQFMAVSLILFFADYIFEKKYFKFLVVSLVAYSIHASAIVWIPAMFIIQGKAWNWKTIAFSFSMVLAVIFVDKFTGLLSDSLADTSYAGYTEQFAEDDGSNIMHTLIAAVPVALSFLERKRINALQNRTISILTNISIIGVMFSLLANFTSGILVGRMPIYFTVFNYALYTWLFEFAFGKEDRKALRPLCVCGYAAYALYYMTQAWGSSGMPYISDILGINTWR